ncbi:acyltransferase [Clostridium sp. VAP41]|uniref:acyltransferase n=1 Tax=Clostridium sp. VAP41 TaxID=2949979 RepID=UPI00207A086B|nr:acyltransferase [Clostridium sp. VAP41]
MNLINIIKSKFARFYYPIRIKKVSKHCMDKPYVGGKSYVTSYTTLGKNVCFNGMSISGEGEVYIGDNFHSGTNCQIITSFHNYDFGSKIPYDETFINKDVIIEDNVWLGNNVIILGGCKIGEGAIIQAGSVVCKNIPKYAIAGGHPAIPFRYRDIKHYELLKNKNKFH